MHCIEIHLDIVSKIGHINRPPMMMTATSNPDDSGVVDYFMEKVVSIPFVDESEMEAAFENMMDKLEGGAKFLRIRGMGIATANIFLVEMVRHVEV